MNELEKKMYDLLDKEGVQILAKGILDKVNTRIAQRIVQVMDVNDDTHVPSSAAVLKAIASAHNLKIQVVVGDIDQVVPLEERSTNVLYLQKDDEQDPSWNMFIWDANPDLQPDPNGKWICIGDTEIDLSNYWSKDAEDMADLSAALGVDGLLTDMTTAKANIANLQSDVSALQSSTADIEAELEKKVNYDDISEIPAADIIRIVDNADTDTNPFVEPAETIEDVQNAIDDAIASGKTEVSVRLTADIDLTSGATNMLTIPSGVIANIRIPAGNKITCSGTGLQVNSGAGLTLSGSGTIVKNGKGANGAIRVENGGVLNLDGITIDATTQGKEDNYAYGVYAKNSSVVNFRSGVIKVALASCISTNNLTGGSVINVSGGELYSDGCYAIYCPAQGTVNITGGKVQGVLARMGTINVSGDAEIIPPTIDAETCDDIGANINTSGSLALGDAIAVIAGSYSDPSGVDATINIEANSTVKSNFRSAIGVYMLDTKVAANVAVNVYDSSAVSTTDAGADDIKVYDHAYISAAAAAAGKTYSPVATSTVTVNVQN